MEMLKHLVLVIDLALRFTDGRLSAEKLARASDEELAEMLIQVRGIGMVSSPYFYTHHS